MDAKIEQALKNYSRTGWGAKVPQEDQDAVSDFVVKTLQESGLEALVAIKLVHLIEGGRWSDGWETGYEAAKSFYTARFSLTTEGYGSQEFRDEIAKSEA